MEIDAKIKRESNIGICSPNWSEKGETEITVLCYKKTQPIANKIKFSCFFNFDFISKLLKNFKKT